ncbi:MAG TPA: GTPase HflX [Lachnospiraceae bacterium]|nr:GTPase HflX [Lachnospiraceae bacterium]
MIDKQEPKRKQQNDLELEKVILVGVNLGDGTDFKLSMSELVSLAKTCNMEVVGQVEQNLSSINKGLYIGTGKVIEVYDLARELDAACIVFNNPLSPTQLRNLQDELKMPVLDRTTLILEIFSSRAKSREAMLQVEVAKLQYFLPRLVGLNEALSRQGGGSGSRSNKGSGEKKLELDRRKLELRLDELKKELITVSKERQIQRKKRAKSGIPRVALVGYTNAGKSTLMNAMVDTYMQDDTKKVMAKDMLFATLDTTVRKIAPPNRTTMLLSDTVGFISQLPHNLVEAFQSTLEEAKEADVLLQVVDYSDSDYKKQIAVTNDTLKELGAGDIPMLYIYNKADLSILKETLPLVEEDIIYISAKEKIGLEEILIGIEKKLEKDYMECTMLIPFQRGDLVSLFNETGTVRETEYLEDGIKLKLNCRLRDYKEHIQYVVE